jgi:hypothetical protein
MDRNSSVGWLNGWQTRRGLRKSQRQRLIFHHFGAIRPCSDGSVVQYELVGRSVSVAQRAELAFPHIESPPFCA